MGTPHPDMAFYGTATVGTKGQIVIPAKAREAIGIASGDTLVVLGVKDRTMLALCPVESVEAMLVEMTKKLDSIRAAIDETKTKGQ